MRTFLAVPLAATLALVPLGASFFAGVPAAMAQNAPAATVPPAATPGQAPAGVPAQIGNTYDDRHHEPAPGATRAAEQDAGVGLSQPQQQQQTDTVEQLARQLENKAHKDTGVAVGCGVDPATCTRH